MFSLSRKNGILKKKKIEKNIFLEIKFEEIDFKKETNFLKKKIEENNFATCGKLSARSAADISRYASLSALEVRLARP